MKKIISIMALTILVIGCSEKPLETPHSEETAKNNIFKVVVDKIGPDTKVTFTDGKGFAWEESDNTNFRYITSGTEANLLSNAINIDQATGKATFTFGEKPTAGSKIWFLYAASFNAAGNKREATFHSVQTQDTPGKVNKENLIFKSGETFEMTEETESVQPAMNLVGTLQRFLIYSANYADEKVESIKMTSNENIAGLIGYNDEGQPINNTEVEVDGEKVLVTVPTEFIYWNPSNTITTSITNPEIIEATSKETIPAGKGIYMSVAPVQVSGYSYIITTDMAEYTLDASNVSKTFENGKIVNIFVNLDNVPRADKSAQTLTYSGGLGDSYTVGFEAGSTGLSWWVANIDGTQDTANRELYDNSNFSITDEGGNAVTWITCTYRNGDTWWDVTYEANTSSSSRTAVITYTYPTIGYKLEATAKIVKVTQGGATDEKVLTYQNKAIGNQVWDAAAAERNTGNWFVAYINNIAKDGGFHGENYYRHVVFDCEPAADWVSFYLPENNNNIWANVAENTTGAERSVTVTVKYDMSYAEADGLSVTPETAVVGTFTFTQSAATE